jgi:hypothetical protein
MVLTLLWVEPAPSGFARVELAKELLYGNYGKSAARRRDTIPAKKIATVSLRPRR